MLINQFSNIICVCSVHAYNDGDVNVGSLLDSLSIGARVGDNDQTGLLERAGDVVGEVTGGETTGNGDSAGVGSELEDSTLAIRTSRDNADCVLSDTNATKLYTLQIIHVRRIAIC